MVTNKEYNKTIWSQFKKYNKNCMFKEIVKKFTASQKSPLYFEQRGTCRVTRHIIRNMVTKQGI